MKNKTHLFFFFLFFAFLFGEATLIAGVEKWEQLSLKVDKTTGKEKIDLLEKLSRRYKYQDPRLTSRYVEEGLRLLNEFPDTRAEISFLNSLSTVEVTQGNFSKGMNLATRAMELARKINDKLGIARAYNNFCYVQWNTGEYENSIENGLKGMELIKEVNDPDGIAEAYITTGISYGILGDKRKNLEYHFKALSVYEKMEDPNNLGNAYNNIASIYTEINEYEKALEFLYKAMDAFKKYNHKSGIPLVLGNIASIFINQEKYKEALDYAQKALQLSTDSGLSPLIINNLENIGIIYEETNNIPLAMESYKKAFDLAQKQDNLQSISNILTQMGIASRKTGKLAESLSYLQRSLEIAQRIKSLNEIINSHFELSETLSAMKKNKDALFHYKKFAEYDNIGKSEKNSEEIAHIQVRYNLEIKEKQLEVLKKEMKIQELKLQRQANVWNVLIFLFFLIGLLAILMYARYRLKAKTNRFLANEIEARKKTAQLLIESENKFRNLAEHSIVPIYILQDGAIKYTNPAASRVFEYPLEELIEMNPLDIVHPDDKSLVTRNIRSRLDQLKCTGNTGCYEFRGITKNGKIVYLESYGGGFIYQGKPAIVGTLIDISARKHAETELIKSMKLEAIGILAGGIAHDFNNLLTIITFSVSMAKDEQQSDPKLSEILTIIEDAIQRITNLSNKLTAFSRSELSMSRELQFRDIIKTTYKNHPDIRHLIKELPPVNGDYPIFGDERLLREVLANIFKNADDSMSEPKKLSVNVENTSLPPRNNLFLPAGPYVRITISDNGKGIPPELLTKLQDPYFITQKKEPLAAEGKGLGIAICQSIIKKHHGHFSIQSQLEKGTQVEILLPSFNYYR